MTDCNFNMQDPSDPRGRGYICTRGGIRCTELHEDDPPSMRYHMRVIPAPWWWRLFHSGWRYDDSFPTEGHTKG